MTAAAVVVAAATVVNKFTPLKAPAELLILIVMTTRVEDVATVTVDPAERSDTKINVDNFETNVAVIVSIFILEEDKTALELDKSAVMVSVNMTTAFMTVPEEVLLK